MPGIGVITNPRSRANQRDPSSMQRLGYLVGSRGSAAATQSLSDLNRVAHEWKREDIDVLGINGGDGTIHHTLTAFIRAWGDQPLPMVALLRGGTMNTICASLGIHGDPRDLLFQLVDRYHSGEPLHTEPQRLLSVGGDKFGCIFGNGVIYNFLDAYYATGRPSPATAAELLLKGALSATVGGDFARRLTRPFAARVTVDGELWAREDFVAVAIATVEQIGLGFKPFYRVSEDPLAFPVLGVHGTAADLLTELPSIFRGLPMRRDKVIDRVAREVVFESISAPLSDGADAAAEVEYIIDGDTYRSPSPLHVTLGPTLRLVRLDRSP